MFKKIFKDLVNSKFMLSFIVGFVVVLMYHFVVLPGLSLENTLINVGSAVLAVMLLMFLYFFIKHHYFSDEEFELFTPDPNKEPETELDYNPNSKSKSKRGKSRKKQTKKN